MLKVDAPKGALSLDLASTVELAVAARSFATVDVRYLNLKFALWTLLSFNFTTN